MAASWNRMREIGPQWQTQVHIVEELRRKLINNIVAIQCWVHSRVDSIKRGLSQPGWRRGVEGGMVCTVMEAAPVHRAFRTSWPALQRQFRLCILFLVIARPLSQFPHSCVCERFIYFLDRSTYFLQQKRQTHREYIIRSQTHERENWD